MIIIFQDEDILVLDKPAGMVVNNSNTFSGETVQDFLKSLEVNEDGVGEEVPEDEIGTNDFSERSGIVHRLDKATSGVLVVAKTPKAFTILQSQFKLRKVEKEYRAIVIGKFAYDKVEIDAPLGRNPQNRLSIAVVEGGKPALTLVEKLKEAYDSEVKTDYSMLVIKPKTGRTHQIRVHLAALNKPIAGDEFYCTKKQYDISVAKFGRLMLHAEKIRFTHPTNQKTVEYISPLPAEFMVLFG